MANRKLTDKQREILEYLKEPGDVLPWDKKEAEKPRKVTSTKFGKKEATEK